MEKYHIGQEILKEVKAKYPSVAAFARDLCKSSSATYEIFGKTSLDTDLLLKVSKLLNRDFFREFSEKCLNGEVTVVDKQTAENSLSLLQPDNTLYKLSPRKTLDVVEEYFLLLRKKPLVVFYNSARSHRLDKEIYKLGEEIFGEDTVKKMLVKQEDIQNLMLSVSSLVKLPHKVIFLKCTTLQNYETHLLIAEKLMAESRKHVVLLCHDPIHLFKNYDGSMRLKSFAVSTFNLWNGRIHTFISDDRDKTFTYRIELCQAINGKGYMDRIYDSVTGKDTFPNTAKLLAEAKQNLSTFEDKVLSVGDYMDELHIEVHQVSTIQPSLAEFEKLEKDGFEIRTHLRYLKTRETGKIFQYETMGLNQVKKILAETRDTNNKQDI